MSGGQLNDAPAFMQLKSNVRNIFLAILSVIALGFNMFFLYRNVHSLMNLNSGKEKRAFYTQLSISILLGTISLLTPVVSIRRLNSHRIHQQDKDPSIWSLFKLRNPFATKHQNVAKHITEMIYNANKYIDGEEVSWNDVEILKENEKVYVKLLVEESISVNQRDGEDGSIYFEEICPWLILFAHLVLFGAIQISIRLTFQEIKSLPTFSDINIGKSLSEWLTNYVLVAVALLQLVTRGGWLKSFSGICVGASSTMNIYQRNALVALYIASTEKRIEGLRREFCYNKDFYAEMDGYKWVAPPVSTAVIAATRGNHFFKIEKQTEGKCIVKWEETSENPPPHLKVATVGSTGSIS